MHVPALTNVIVAPFVPPAVHTDGVVVVNDTGRPDDADALTVTDGCANVTLPNAPNVIA